MSDMPRGVQRGPYENASFRVSQNELRALFACELATMRSLLRPKSLDRERMSF